VEKRRKKEKETICIIHKRERCLEGAVAGSEILCHGKTIVVPTQMRTCEQHVYDAPVEMLASSRNPNLCSAELSLVKRRYALLK
jgi:hypothetical protein